MKLINRTLRANEAKSILIELINTQINNYRVENFKNSERFGSENPELNDQINEIINSKKDIISVVNKAGMDDKKVRIIATIEVEIVEEIENKL